VLYTLEVSLESMQEDCIGWGECVDESQPRDRGDA